MTSKLGPHFIGAPGLDDWIAVEPKVYKFDPTGLGASSMVPAGPLVIGKLDQQDSAIGLTDWKALRNQGHSPEAAADKRFYAQTAINVGPNKPPVNRYTANPRIDVWEDDNEVVPDNTDEAEWYATYCVAMMMLYEGIGKKRANFSFAVGTPEPGIWTHLLPAIEYARDNGHYIALHEYMGYEADYGVGWRQVDANRNPTNDVWHGRPDKSYPWGWAALRYRYIWDTVLSPAGLGDTRLLITELGCDSVPSVTPATMPCGSWLAMGLSDEKYFDMLAWYDDRIKEDAYVIGAMVFTVGSVGVWANWDIAGTDCEAYLQDHVFDLLDDPDVPPPVQPPTEPPPVMSNLLLNPSFDKGWTDDPTYPATQQNPLGWKLLWNLTDKSKSGATFLLGEGVHKDTFPDDELGVLKWDGPYSYKVFAAYRPIWARMKQTLDLPAGQYLLKTPAFVDCFHWKGYKDYDLDAQHAETMVKVNGAVVRDWTPLTPGQRNDTATIINHAGGVLDLAVHFRAHWAVANNGFFLDGWSLEPVTVAPPPPPPPPDTGYIATVVKLPQGATIDEWLKAADYAWGFQHTITASDDDMLAVLDAGNALSYVKLAWPEKQPATAELIAEAGYSYEPLFAVIPKPPVEPPPPAVDARPIIDISHHQGAINWNKFAPKVAAVIIRLGYGVTEDREARRNVAEATARGVPFAVYHYFVPTVDATAQGKFFGNLAKEIAPGRLCAVDLEEKNGVVLPTSRAVAAPEPPTDRELLIRQDLIDAGYIKTKGNLESTANWSIITPAALAAKVKIYIDALAEIADHEAMIYSNMDYWGNWLGAPSWGIYHPLWIAAWTNASKPIVPKPFVDWDAWQYAVKEVSQSEWGVFSERLDFNRLHPEYEPADFFDDGWYAPDDDAIDMLPYLRGDGRMFEVQHVGAGTETFQTQTDAQTVNTFYLVKNSQWEQLYFDSGYIWRGRDTSPGGGRFYVQFEPGLTRARWMPRYMSVGQSWTGPGHYVQYHMKADCSKSEQNSGNATNRMTFRAYYQRLTWNGVTVDDVVELTNNHETWWYARGFGLVAWKSLDGGEMAICQVYAPGERPALVREKINCL